MILFIIVFALLIIGIVSCIKEYIEWGWTNEIGEILIFIATTCLIVMSVVWAVNHIAANETIIENKETYDSLTYRIEYIDSDYEDMSKSDLIEDINEWNIYVKRSKYWTYNVWTSWFFSKRVTDNLQYIPISEVK